MKFKKTLTAVGVAAIAGAGAMSVLPDAQAASPKNSQEIIQLAACNPCAAKKACGACNPCAAKKKACGACNPCAAKKACNPCNPCNPCAAKKTN